MNYSFSGEIITEVDRGVVGAVKTSDVLRRKVGVLTEPIWSFILAAPFQGACNSCIAGLCL